MENQTVSPEVFENLLELSRLSANDSDRESLEAHLQQIAQYFELLSDYDKKIPKKIELQPFSAMPLRPDTIQKGIDLVDLKKMSSEFMDGYFRVPKVLGSGA